MTELQTPFKKSEDVRLDEYSLTLEYFATISEQGVLRVQCVPKEQHPPTIPVSDENDQFVTISITDSNATNLCSTEITLNETCLPIHADKQLSNPVFFTKQFTSIGSKLVTDCSSIHITITSDWKYLPHQPIELSLTPFAEIL